MTSYYRPYGTANCWVAAVEEQEPTLTLTFDAPTSISRLRLFFDSDYDQALEPIQMGHYDNISPLCVQAFAIYDDQNRCLYQATRNHSSCCTVDFDAAVTTQQLTIQLIRPSAHVPAVLYGLLINE